MIETKWRVNMVYGSFREPTTKKNFFIIRMPETRGRVQWSKRIAPALDRLIRSWYTDQARKDDASDRRMGREGAIYWNVEGDDPQKSHWDLEQAVARYEWNGLDLIPVTIKDAFDRELRRLVTQVDGLLTTPSAAETNAQQQAWLFTKPVDFLLHVMASPYHLADGGYSRLLFDEHGAKGLDAISRDAVKQRWHMLDVQQAIHDLNAYLMRAINEA